MSSNAITALLLGGERTSGEPVRKQNVLAACSIINIVKSSLGPVWFCKMHVDHVDDVTITNDGATTLKLLDLVKLQDEEVRDGGTSVVILAAALLKGSGELISRFVHSRTIINGCPPHAIMRTSLKRTKFCGEGLSSLRRIMIVFSEIHSFANKFGFARESPGTQLNFSFLMFPCN
ncbi:T-complex protein 1 subunit alpha [Clonorchis sinensis]|uniref:T-complex protein 1 subunit alpha n=1 Tax=Clonorchis sinensis TaxID=79923 RepID=A0A3R7CA08_CLOSI|nr:T-complex protein 1 subunit alpha [Clonorchis sinensis]